jgi:hypothetical protein
VLAAQDTFLKKFPKIRMGIDEKKLLIPLFPKSPNTSSAE